MNIHLQKIGLYIKGIYSQLKSIFLELPRNQKIAVIVILLIVISILGRLLFSESEIAEEITAQERAVTVRLVSDISNKESSIPLLGIVTSTSEATVRAESSGKLTRVYKKLGDTVYAGQIIAEFDNSGERASLLQAEGVYDAAKASRDITKINNTNTGSSLSEAKNSALNTIASAYNAMDDSVRAKTDAAYTSPRQDRVEFNLSVPDSVLISNLESKRVSIEKILLARDTRNRTLTVENDLLTELTTIQKEAELIKTYLDDLSTAYSKAIVDDKHSQAVLDGGKASVNAARSQVSSTLSSLSGARSALTGSMNAEAITGTISGTGSTGAADAQVKQAQGAYNAALSRLEKTVIRSPITGTLNSLTIQTGDFVSQFTEVAVVSNNGALEVLSYVTEEDAKRIFVGSEVTIDNTIKGVITRVAPALDPRTKKIEVRVGIRDTKASLTNGQSVRISITNTKSTKTVSTAANSIIKIPISALKLTPNGAFVFTISTTSTLIPITVREGAILGEEIQIISGLTGNEEIVTDARGLKAGMTVTVIVK